MLVSSHISSDLEGLCDDLYMIHEGKIVMHEDTDVLLSDYALLKMDERQYADLDKRYLLRRRKEPYGYAVLTSQKQFYMENYPQLTVEKGSIDDVIMMMIVGGGAWLLSVVLSGILITIRNPQISVMDWLPIDLLYICIVLLFAAVMIPVQLKFGGERGRVALLLTVGVAVLGSMGVIKLLEILQVDLDAVLASMNTLNMMQIGGAAGIFSIVLLAISYRISCRVMKNKEF